MLQKPLRLALMACLPLIAGGAQADAEVVKKDVEAYIGAPAVEAVTSLPYGGLYEVLLKSGELVYTDERVAFIIDGRIIDTTTRRDVTQARLVELSAIDFDALPLERAIKQVRGTGKRVLVSFEDPNCGYCKRLGKELAGIDDVTIYTFLYPILGEDSVRKSRNIWCAQDQAKAWNDWILDNKTPAVAECDSSVVDANVELGRALRINGTPTMFLVDGQRIGGYRPADQIEQVLDVVSR